MKNSRPYTENPHPSDFVAAACYKNSDRIFFLKVEVWLVKTFKTEVFLNFYTDQIITCFNTIGYQFVITPWIAYYINIWSGVLSLKHVFLISAYERLYRSDTKSEL
jgi:hypothetical protein